MAPRGAQSPEVQEWRAPSETALLWLLLNGFGTAGQRRDKHDECGTPTLLMALNDPESLCQQSDIAFG
jgi:hypothetical protein